MNFSTLISERSRERPLYQQLIQGLEGAIQAGDLKDGDRLPSERALAKRIKVSRTTVVNAYRELETRGLLRSHVGRGTFVCPKLEQSDAPFAWRGKVSVRTADIRNDLVLRRLAHDASDSRLISFAAGAPALECFPLDAYRRSSERLIKNSPSMVFGFGPTEGQPRLRKAIAKRFSVNQEKVLILSGAQQGLDLIARCLLDPGDVVVIDRPGYIGAIQTFRSAGAKLVGWDVARADINELDDLLLRYRPKLIYTNPTFQNPTGRLLLLRERLELLKVATRYRVPVIEDDTYRELYFNQPTPASLYHLDIHHIVIHLSSFSKVLAPGLRLGWLAASEYIVDQLASIKQRRNIFTENFGQLVLADLLEGGLFDEHLANLRDEHRKRRDAMAKTLQEWLAGRIEFTIPHGGIYLWCRLHGPTDTAQLLKQALEKGVAFANGEIFYPDHAGKNELRLCFSSVPVDQIQDGVKRLSRALHTSEDVSVKREGIPVPLV